MFAKATTWLGIIFLVILPVAGLAQNEKDDLAQEIYARSGMEKQFQQIPLLIQAGFDQAASEDQRLRSFPPDLIGILKGLAGAAFAPDIFREAVVGELQKKLSLGELRAVIRWLDSPVGDRCSRLEEAASTPEALPKMEQYAAKLKDSPPPPERLALLRKFDAAVLGTKNSVEVMLDTQIAVAMAIVSTLPLEQQVPRAHVARELEKVKPQIEAAAEMQTLISMLYTYRSLSEGEIQQYIDFLISPAGSKYQAAATAVVKRVLFDGSVKWGKGIGMELQRAKDKSRT